MGKGNVDADLVLHAMIEFSNYDKAMIVSGDGDFHCLIEYLEKKGKLLAVLSPNYKRCSGLLKQHAKEKIFFVDNLRWKLEYKKSTA